MIGGGECPYYKRSARRFLRCSWSCCGNQANDCSHDPASRGSRNRSNRFFVLLLGSSSLLSILVASLARRCYRGRLVHALGNLVLPDGVASDKSFALFSFSWSWVHRVCSCPDTCEHGSLTWKMG